MINILPKIFGASEKPMVSGMLIALAKHGCMSGNKYNAPLVATKGKGVGKKLTLINGFDANHWVFDGSGAEIRLFLV